MVSSRILMFETDFTCINKKDLTQNDIDDIRVMRLQKNTYFLYIMDLMGIKNDNMFDDLS
jgi:hypothetical protein